MNFYDNLEKYSSNIAIITEQSENISYEEFLTSADSIGKQIKKRCLVFMICKNCFESVTGYIGFLRAGAVLVLISEKIDNIFFAVLLESYKPAYIYLPSEKTGFQINSELVSSFHSYKLLKTNYKTNYSINDTRYPEAKEIAIIPLEEITRVNNHIKPIIIPLLVDNSKPSVLSVDETLKILPILGTKDKINWKPATGSSLLRLISSSPVSPMLTETFPTLKSEELGTGEEYAQETLLLDETPSSYTASTV